MLLFKWKTKQKNFSRFKCCLSMFLTFLCGRQLMWPLPFQSEVDRSCAYSPAVNMCVWFFCSRNGENWIHIVVLCIFPCGQLKFWVTLQNCLCEVGVLPVHAGTHQRYCRIFTRACLYALKQKNAEFMLTEHQTHTTVLQWVKCSVNYLGLNIFLF